MFDGYLQWWLDQGEGSTEQRWFSFHVCAKTPATCRGSKGHPDLEFHLESFRSIPLAELGTAQQAAWLAQPAAAVDLKWELDRLGGQPPPPAAAEKKGGKREKERGKDPAAPSWGRAPGAEGKPAGLAAELLAGVGRRSGKAVARSRPSAVPQNPVRGRGLGRGPVADAEAGLEKKRRRWLNPDGHCSVSSGSERSRGRSPEKPRSADQSVGREKIKRKRRRKGGAGPATEAAVLTEGPSARG